MTQKDSLAMCISCIHTNFHALSKVLSLGHINVACVDMYSIIYLGISLSASMTDYVDGGVSRCGRIRAEVAFCV